MDDAPALLKFSLYSRCTDATNIAAADVSSYANFSNVKFARHESIELGHSICNACLSTNLQSVRKPRDQLVQQEYPLIEPMVQRLQH